MSTYFGMHITQHLQSTSCLGIWLSIVPTFPILWILSSLLVYEIEQYGLIMLSHFFMLSTRKHIWKLWPTSPLHGLPCYGWQLTFVITILIKYICWTLLENRAILWHTTLPKDPTVLIYLSNIFWIWFLFLFIAFDKWTIFFSYHTLNSLTLSYHTLNILS